ncbi:MAG: cation:proton antiporter [Proteobacteria bacterium]|nr:cation:proton antiporter [Pseudomonadota bacterium]
MDQDGFLFKTFVFLAAACLVVPLANRFRLGSVIGYLVAGILIGPFGFGLIGNTQAIMHFAEFGIVMMLFLIGLELDPTMLWKMRKAILGLGSLQILFTTFLFAIIGLALGYSWQVCVTCAMALSLSSTALGLQILQEKVLLNTPGGNAAFAVLLFQDIAVIPILIVMPLLTLKAAPPFTTTNAFWIDSLNNWEQALVTMIAITFVVFVGRYFSRYVFHFVAKTNIREVFTATSLALVVGITLLMQLVGISPALGAFIAGLVLANSEYKHTLETDIEPFKGLLLGLFFISIGMGMNFNFLIEHPYLLIGGLVIFIAGKMTILFALGKGFGLVLRQNALFTVTMSQGGEFAFVLFQYATGLKILNKSQASFLTMMVALSMAITPFLMILYEKFIFKKHVSSNIAYDTIRETDSTVIMAGYGRFGQIIGRFMSAQGLKLTILEKDPDQIEQIRRFGIKAYFGDASRLDLLRNAGIEKAKMLIIAIDDADKAIEIVNIVKQLFPHVQILARARNRRHAYNLYKAGVDYFKRETFDSALSMGQAAMRRMGKPAQELRYKAKKFKQHDEKTLKTSFAFFEKEPELISFSKQARHELERILQSDIEKKSS